MNSYHEDLERGTFDFPLDLHIVSENHPKYHMQMHWHKDFEIIHISSGSFNIKLNEKNLTLQKGDSIIIPGGIIHGGEPSECIYECLVFSPALLYAAPKCRSLIKTHTQNPILLSNNKDIAFILANLKERTFGYEFDVIAKLYSLIGEYVKSNPEFFVSPNKSLDKIKAAISMIEENYGTKISLDDLSKVCGMSPNYFSRLFKNVTGESPFEYIVNYRLNAACGFLTEIGYDGNITDVSYKCGFNDLSYFIHTFKNHYGMTPKAYAQIHKN